MKKKKRLSGIERRWFVNNVGVIMLLVPGIPFTNAIRDILLGDIISGSLRLVEAVLLAAMLALGMMAAIWLMGGAA